MNNDNSLPLIPEDDSNPVPVFSCHVILGKSDSNGQLTGRVANLADISATGSSERDVLTAVMKQFKESVRKCVQMGQEVPWVEPPASPLPGEAERFIPVHL